MIPNNEKANQECLIKDIKEKTKYFKRETVILLDADRTLCESDTSRFLNDLANIDLREIKEGFEKHGYTYPGFKSMSEIYSRLKIPDYLEYSKETAKQINLYPGVIDFIKKSQRFADICIITSGVKKIWENILKNNGLDDILLIGGIHNNIDDYLVGRSEKGVIANFFMTNGRIIIAFGDSDVDSLMLQKANHAVIIVNHRNNADLLPHIKDHSSLYQISHKDYYHDNIVITDYKSISKEFKNLISRG